MSNVERMFAPRARDLGGFTVGRVLPYVERRAVGPFVFLDHMGPADMPAGQGVDVRPHPHIGLSTLTYLFAGEMFHRDNLGNAVEIKPGEVNWMTAGRGIAHSERSSAEARRTPHTLHGMQNWVGLPRADEEIAPGFSHYAANSIPTLTEKGTTLRVIAGEAYGKRSPVATYSPLFYVEARLDAGATLRLPDGYDDRAFYTVEGRIAVNGTEAGERMMTVFNRGRGVAEIKALAPSHVMLLGGEPFSEPRHVWWNFVSSSRDRIEEAKADWKAGRFARIPGDDKEFIPLPEESH